MAPPSRPSSREQFRVAIICALPRESNAVTLLFDDFYARNDGGHPYSKAPGDTNYYTLGRIGQHDVVLTTLPEMGITSAAVASANLQVSFTGLRLVLLVGICGGVPIVSRRNVFMGDVVISRSVVQYDYGRQYPDHFLMKKEIEDSLGRASRDIRSLVSHLQGEHNKEQMCETAAVYLKELQDKARNKRREATYTRPSSSEDILYDPTYLHKCRNVTCENCTGVVALLCDTAMGAYCAELGCEKDQMTTREERASDQRDDFQVLIGRVGSGNTVMKSAMERDRIAKAHNLIAFEMEAAGAWEDLPCLVVKGVCDYADSHKSDTWQDFAAATAACVGKAILDFYSAEQPAIQIASPDSTLNGLLSPPPRTPVDAIRDDLSASRLSTPISNSSRPPSWSATPVRGLTPERLSAPSLSRVARPTSRARDPTSERPSSHSPPGIACSDDGGLSPPPPHRTASSPVRTSARQRKENNALEGIADQAFHIMYHIYACHLRVGDDLIQATFKSLGAAKHAFAALELIRSRNHILFHGTSTGKTYALLRVPAAAGFYASREPMPFRRDAALPDATLTGESYKARDAISAGLESLAQVFPQPYIGSWGPCDSLIDHALRTIEWAYHYQCDEQLARTPLVARAAEYLRQRGRYNEVERHFTKVLKIRSSVLGDNHASTLMTKTRLARILNKQRQPERAEELASSALWMQREKFGNSATDTVKTMIVLAVSYRGLGREQQALALTNEALKVQRQRLGPDHAEFLQSECQLAAIWCSQHFVEHAERLTRKVLEKQRELVGENHPDTMITEHTLGWILLRQERYESAQSHLSRAIKMQTALLGEGHPDTTFSMSILALAYHQQGLYEQAKKLTSRIMHLRFHMLGEKHPATLEAMHHLALARYGLREHQDAILLMRKCCKLQVEVLGRAAKETLASTGTLDEWEGMDVPVIITR